MSGRMQKKHSSRTKKDILVMLGRIASDSSGLRKKTVVFGLHNMRLAIRRGAGHECG